MTNLTDKMIDAALPHVAFDGWSQATFEAAMEDSGAVPAVAKAAFPRGAVDLALAFHKRGDAQMVAALKTRDLYDLRFRDRVAHAVRLRLELAEPHKEAVRRGTTLFALPLYAADGAKAVWGTCDAIWDTLGDMSEDYNWYTKRSILSAVYGSTVLFWLGDESEDHAATWDFLDRRIDNVMQFEKVKGATLNNPMFAKVFAGPLWALGKVKAPSNLSRTDLPGQWRDPSAS